MAKITPTSIIQQIVAATPIRPQQKNAPVNSTTQFLDTEPKRDKKILLRQLKRVLVSTSNLEAQGVRNVIQEILAWAFGEEIRNAQHFSTTVARVEHFLSQNPKAKEKIWRLIKALTKT